MNILNNFTIEEGHPLLLERNKGVPQMRKIHSSSNLATVVTLAYLYGKASNHLKTFRLYLEHFHTYRALGIE